jgi:MFS family permease
MGIATFTIGLIPGYSSIGIAAPILFVSMRMLQGLALGGEYGGAVVYVAEHTPGNNRGLMTSWIQVTSGSGLLLSLLVILITRFSVGDANFAEWGWRIPFLVSAVLLGISVWVRIQLHESPVYKKMKEEGKLSKSPLKEAVTDKKNLKRILISLFGPVIGEAVVWYTGQFYVLYFLVQSIKVDAKAANIMMVVATIITLPLYIFFGALSDRVGRKPVVLTGMILGAAFFFPLFGALTHNLNPALEQAEQRAPVVLYANPETCSVQFNPVGTAEFTSPCDVAKAALAKAGIRYENRPIPAESPVSVTVGDIRLTPADSKAQPGEAKLFNDNLAKTLDQSGYQKTPAMVELFPARLRYTSMSLPYHIGIGWIGGFLPATTFAIVASTGNPYSGLWYPVIIAIIAAVVTLVFLPETHKNSIN